MLLQTLTKSLELRELPRVQVFRFDDAVEIFWVGDFATPSRLTYARFEVDVARLARNAARMAIAKTQTLFSVRKTSLASRLLATVGVRYPTCQSSAGDCWRAFGTLPDLKGVKISLSGEDEWVRNIVWYVCLYL
jgi:hypothetical protein